MCCLHYFFLQMSVTVDVYSCNELKTFEKWEKCLMGCLDAFPRGQKTFEKICIYHVQCLKKKKCLCGVILQMWTVIYIFHSFNFQVFPFWQHQNPTESKKKIKSEPKTLFVTNPEH